MTPAHSTPEAFQQTDGGRRQALGRPDQGARHHGGVGTNEHKNPSANAAMMPRWSSSAAGPVGMGLAIELGQRGVRTLVVERYPQPQPIPKGQNLTQRTMEHFHFWGAEKALRAARTIPPEYGIGGLTAYGTLLGPHTLRLAAARAGQALLLHGQRAAAAVRDGSGAAPARGGTALRADAVRLGRRDGGPGRRGRVRSRSPRATAAPARVLRCAYAVGCDGARSLVREQAGITQTRTDHDRMMVLLVFRSHAAAHAAGALPRQVLLQRAAARRSRATGSSSAASTWAAPGSSMRRCRPARPGQFRLLAPTFKRPSARASTSSSSTSGSGTCASCWPTATARAASSSRAMRRTATRPMAATA